MKDIRRIIKDAGLQCIDVTQRGHYRFTLTDGETVFKITASATPYAGETSLKIFKRDLRSCTMKQKAKRNLLAKSLSSPMFRKRVTKSRKGGRKLQQEACNY